MKVFVIVVVIFALMIITESRHNSKHHKRPKKSSIAHKSSSASKRQYYTVLPEEACCDNYGYSEPYSCCQLPNSPPCCETLHQTQHTVISTTNNCCQTSNAPPCCSRVPQQMSLQVCCGSVRPEVSQPCCIPVETAVNQQQNISVGNTSGNKFVLSVKLIPDGRYPAGGQLCQKPCPTQPVTKPTTATTTVGTTVAPTISIQQLCRERALAEHNVKRAIHNASAMVLDNYLNAVAEALAKAHLARTQNTEQQQDDLEGKRRWGVNIFNISGFNPDDELDCKTVVDTWYDEVRDYSFSSPSYSDDTKHFTQLVWKESTKLGIGIAVSDDKTSPNGKSYVVVATYVKPGNIAGQFSENVQKGDHEGAIELDQCQKNGLDGHNIKRKIHNAPPMTIDPHLTENADLLAKQLSNTWKPKGNGYHLAGFQGSSNIVAIKISLLDATPDVDVCRSAVEIWYNEVTDYDFNNPGFSEKTQHFTQLVWKTSTKLGIAFAPIDPDYVVVVATYTNGNEDGTFVDNVEQGTYAALSDCEKAVLAIHNKKRPLHAALQVTVDPTLTTEAQQLAERLVRQGEVADTSSLEGPGTSVKLDCEVYSDDEQLCKNSAEDWYFEYKNYDFTKPGLQKDARHFTQMVWRKSTNIGVGLAKAPQYKHGAIYKYWSGVRHGRLANLKRKPQFPDKPEETRTVDSMKYYRGGSYYGQMLVAYFTPKVTGEYQFYLTCDDQCELKISPDDNPKNAKQELYLPSYRSPGSWSRPSRPIKMEAGKSYYIEATMTQIGGGQHISVGVKHPNKPFDGRPIQSDLLLTSPPEICNAFVIKYKEHGNIAGEFEANVKNIEQPGILSRAAKYIMDKLKKLKSFFS